jgi:glycosyltransferase involved in cell wall biosynthesis
MELTVICPFYNEAVLIEKNMNTMLNKLRTLDLEWELIVVNDGSTDDSLALAERVAKTEPKLKLLSYPANKGRGHALRTGLAASTGRIIVTTEADLSWGDNVVTDLYEATQRWPSADIVVASPNLPGGGYENVPWNRVLLSKLGNTIIRTFMLDVVTMNTGMTRAYRREVIQSMPLFEDRKEFHVEVILKATALGLTIKEIPAILAWPEERHTDGGGEKKKPKEKGGGFFASRLFQFVISHAMMSILGNPTRYIWALAGLSLLTSMTMLGVSVVALLNDGVAVYNALMSVSMFILAIILFVFGIQLRMSSSLLRELWIVQREQMVGNWDAPSSIYRLKSERVGAPADAE